MTARTAATAVLVVVLGLLLGLSSTAEFSSASFTSRSDNPQGTVRAAADWTPPTTSLTPPGAILAGSVVLTASAADAETGIDTVAVQYRSASGGEWRTVCTTASAPYRCTWSTPGVVDGSYALRSVTTDRAGYSAVSAVATTVVDNTGPVVTMIDPGALLGGTRTFEATAADPGTGVQTVVLQYAPSGSSTYRDLCTATAAPYSCRYDTRQLPDGRYDLRAVATDRAGNATTSAVVANREVENPVSTVTLAAPKTYLSGGTTLSATAASTAGVQAVRFQYAPAGTTTWSTVCTDTTAPYSCAWTTTGVADGAYDLRTVLVDGKGRETASASVPERHVLNTVVRGVDVQAANGGRAGTMDAGDTITYTYSHLVDLNTISTGWDGSALATALNMQSGWFADSSITVAGSARADSVGSVNLGADYLSVSTSARFDATMTAGAVVVDGRPRTVITVTLGQRTGGGTPSTNSTPTMAWTPSTAVKDLAGKAVSSAAVNETGAADGDF